jgi:hypothetical protein
MRPGFIPILDSRLLALYRRPARAAARALAGVDRPSPRRAYWAAIRHDLLLAGDALAQLRSHMQNSDSEGMLAQAAERLSDVRLLDILAWSPPTD